MKYFEMPDKQLIEEVESRSAFDVSDYTALFREIFKRFKEKCND